MIHHSSYQLRSGKYLLRRFLIAGLVSIGIGLVFLGISCPSCLKNFHYVVRNSIYSLLLGSGLFSYGFVFGWLESRYVDWIKRPIRSLIMVLVFSLVYSSLVIVGVNVLWHVGIDGIPLDVFWSQLRTIMVLELIVFYLIALWFYARSFFYQWRTELENREKLKHEALYLQYKALKTQVNPHFLFNSLNALNALIDIDLESAKKFSMELSRFYRDLLELKGREIIPLSEELALLNRYLYLQKIRFGEKFRFRLKGENFGKAMVVPLSVQMMVENIFKHNVVSAEEVLDICVEIATGQVVITNTYLPKKHREPSMGIGLKNLKERLEYLTGKELQVGVEGNRYRVVLPIIYM